MIENRSSTTDSAVQPGEAEYTQNRRGHWITDPDDPEFEVWVFDAKPSKKEALKGEFDTAWQDGRRPGRKCTAHRSNGDPCRRAAINGGTVCGTHGGRSPQVKRAARARLENAADRMAKELLKIAVSDDAPDHVKLAAIKDALDRAGLSAKTAVQVEVGPTKPFEELLSAVMTGGSRAESRSRRGQLGEQTDDPEADWIDAEVLDAQSVDPDARPAEAEPFALAGSGSKDSADAASEQNSDAPAAPTGYLPIEDVLAQLHAAAPPTQAPAPHRRARS